MNRWTRLLVVCSATFALSACFVPNPDYCMGSCAGEVPAELLRGLVPGTSTREEVLMTLGVPQRRRNDDRFFVYSWSRITGSWCISFGYGSGSCSDVEATRYVVMEFAGDRFKRYEWISPNYFTGGNPYEELDKLINEWTGAS